MASVSRCAGRRILEPTHEQFDEKCHALKVARLRETVLKLALSPRTGRLALRKMFAAGVEGRKEASEIKSPGHLAQCL